MIVIDVKDDFLIKNEVLPCKNVTLVYKGKYTSFSARNPITLQIANQRYQHCRGDYILKVLCCDDLSNKCNKTLIKTSKMIVYKFKKPKQILDTPCTLRTSQEIEMYRYFNGTLHKLQ